MSRAMNVNLTQAEVVAKSAAANAIISAIETLPSGGTHVVYRISDGATTMREKFRKNLIDGPVKRSAFTSVRFHD